MGLEAGLVKATGLKEGLLQCASTRGWGFIMAWAHRISGVAVVGFMFFHIFTLSGLYTPEEFAAKMAFMDNGLFAFLEWILAVPVIYHAFNGGRLILYELFRVRDDGEMMRWVLGLGTLYVSSLGLFMVTDNQQVSAGVFWFVAVASALIAAFVVSRKLWPTRNGTFWKLQRISGAFLLPMVSGHFFFMHLNHQAGHDVNTILTRVSHVGIKVTDTAFVSLVFFHAGFGLSTIIGDLVGKEHLRTALRLSIAVFMAVFGYAGAKLIISL
jgi:succinate dehydrogenase / fumarate reductase cytochrome b subunit